MSRKTAPHRTILKLTALAAAMLASGLASAGDWTLPAAQMPAAPRDHITYGAFPVLGKDGSYYYVANSATGVPSQLTGLAAGKVPLAAGAGVTAYLDGTITGRATAGGYVPSADSWLLHSADVSGHRDAYYPNLGLTGQLDISNGNLVAYGAYLANGTTAPAAGTVLATGVQRLLAIEVVSGTAANSVQQQLYYGAQDGSIHRYTLGSRDGSQPAGADTVVLSNVGGSPISKALSVLSAEMVVLTTAGDVWRVPASGSPVRMFSGVQQASSVYFGRSDQLESATYTGNGVGWGYYGSSGAWNASYLLLMTDNRAYYVNYSNSYVGQWNQATATPRLTGVAAMSELGLAPVLITTAGRAYTYDTTYGLKRIALAPTVTAVSAAGVAGTPAQVAVTIARDSEADTYAISVKAKTSSTWTAIATVTNPTSGATVVQTITLPAALQDGALFDLRVVATSTSGTATKDVSAFANLPLTGLSAGGSVTANDSTAAPHALDAAISFTDPNGALDTYSAALLTQPTKGAASITTSAAGAPVLHYVPTADLQYTPAGASTTGRLTDTFTLVGTDGAGNIANGTATITINTATAPVISASAQTSSVKPAQGDVGQVDLTYNATYGAQAHRVEKIEILNASGTVIASVPAGQVTTLALGTTYGGALAPGKGNLVSVRVPVVAEAGALTYRITLASSVLGDFSDSMTSTATGPYAVTALPMPTIALTKVAGLTTEDVVEVKVTPPTATCAWTYDAAAAQANSGLCLIEPFGGIAADGENPNILHAYYAPGTVTVGIKASRLISGTMTQFGQASQALTIVQAPAQRYAAGTSAQQLAGLGGVTLLDKISVPLAQTNKTSAPACALYIDRVSAATAAATAGRGCYVVADQLPTGLAIVKDAAGVSIAGRMLQTGDNPVALRIVRVNPGMPDTQVDTLNFAMAGQPVLGAGSVTYTHANKTPSALVDVETVTFAGAGACSQLTTDAAEAAASLGTDVAKCLLEVTPGVHSFAQVAAGSLAWTGTYAAAGVQGLAYRVSVALPATMAAPGVATLVAEGAAQISVGTAPAPTVTPAWQPLVDIAGHPVLDANGRPVIAVPTSGIVGTFTIKAPAPVVATLVAPGYDGMVPANIAAQAALTVTVPAEVRVPGTAYPLRVRVAYKAAPDDATDLQATGLQVPDFRNVLLQTSFAKTVPTVSNLSVSAVVSGSTYDPLQSGVWQIYPAVKSGDALRPLASTDYGRDTAPRTDGVTRLAIPASRLASLITGQTLVVVADYSYSGTVIKRQISGAVNPVLLDLTPLRSVTLAASRTRGALPFAPGITASVPATQNSALGTVDWLISADGGATWSAAGSGRSYDSRIKTAGNYLLKAVAHLKVEPLLTTESAPIAVAAYEVPALTISGHTYGLVSQPLTHQLAARHADGSVADASRISWSVVDVRSQAVLAHGTGATVQYTPTAAGTLRIGAAYLGDGANASAPAEAASRQLTVPIVPLSALVPRLPSATLRVTAKTTVALSGSGVLRETSLRPDELRVAWLLPAGGTLAGTSASWTVSDADEAALSAGTPLRMRVWLEGYEAMTAQVAAVPTRLVSYAWPATWSLTSRRSVSAQAPAMFPAQIGYDAAALSSDQLYMLRSEKLIYTWTLPAGMTTRPDGASANLAANYAGSYPVTVTISDSRGHSATASATFTVLDAPLPVVTATVVGLSTNNRSPASIQVRPSWRRGHPLDKLAGFDVAVDGVAVVTGSLQSSIPLTLPDVGPHSIVVTASSQLATVAADAVAVTVAPNQAPVVTLTATPDSSGKSTRLVAVARDADGKIRQFSWAKDGVEQKTWAGSDRRTVDRTAAPATYTVTVTDDSGATASAEVTVQR